MLKKHKKWQSTSRNPIKKPLDATTNTTSGRKLPPMTTASPTRNYNFSVVDKNSEMSLFNERPQFILDCCTFILSPRKEYNSYKDPMLKWFFSRAKMQKILKITQEELFKEPVKKTLTHPNYNENQIIDPVDKLYKKNNFRSFFSFKNSKIRLQTMSQRPITKMIRKTRISSKLINSP